MVAGLLGLKLDEEPLKSWIGETIRTETYMDRVRHFFSSSSFLLVLVFPLYNMLSQIKRRQRRVSLIQR